MRLFADGSQVASVLTGAMASVDNSPNAVTISSALNAFDGRIDEVRISSSALYGAGGYSVPASPFSTGGSEIGLWHFDDSVGAIADDATGTHDGTITGAAWAGPIWNASLSFDGVDDYVDVPDTALLDITGDISLQAWVNIDDFASSSADKNLYIVSKDAEGNRSYGIGVSARPESPFTGCGAPTGQARAFIIVFRASSIAMACGSTSVSTDVYHHIAGTYNSSSGTATIYLDGVADGTVTAGAGAINVGSADLQIGARQFSTARGFLRATIHDACVFDRELTPVEVALFAGDLSCDDMADITLTPDVAFNPVDTSHTVTASITPPVADIPIAFEVTGAHTLSGSDLTGDDLDDDSDPASEGDGDATFDYAGANDGIDIITACIDLDNDGTCELGEPYDTASKTWFENFVTGGGKINFPNGNGNRAEWTFGGTVGFLESVGPVGQFQIVHHGDPTFACHFDTFSNLVFSNGAAASPPASHDTADFNASGACTDDPTATIDIHVQIQDLGEPGTDTDRIDVAGGLGFSGSLSGGNFQIHNIDS